ncbi:MAG: TOMM precursor leader peptide-binding protein [Armatimonadota bacterium]|nr:TOMM precursor leader peptide-binding protein [Armatimonadota bacterium]MDR7474907.1 TOMM precursor leader peptide-binding protein [Armatimonadota bacterium]MDR7538381.1 TOMM precursor leader peptide-binding protein [Armatimonadota bacterium]
MVAFEGKAVERLLPILLPLLDGTRTVDQIERYLGETASPAARQALCLLQEHDLLADGPAPEPGIPSTVRETVYFLTSQAGSAPLAAHLETLQERSVTVVGSSRLAVEVARLLRLAGLWEVGETSWDADGVAAAPPDLTIVAPSGAELPRLARWNCRALEEQRTWLQVLPFDGAFATVGPLYVPGETCCYQCFRLRRAATVAYREEFLALDDAPAPYPSPPPLEGLVAGLAALLALRWVTRRDPSLPGRFCAVEVGFDVRISHHTVYRVARCDVCSPGEQAASPLPWYEDVLG